MVAMKFFLTDVCLMMEGSGAGSDPDPYVPLTNGSYRSGSGTLISITGTKYIMELVTHLARFSLAKSQLGKTWTI
jgi:hypothetical protein